MFLSTSVCSHGSTHLSLLSPSLSPSLLSLPPSISLVLSLHLSVPLCNLTECAVCEYEIYKLWGLSCVTFAFCCYAVGSHTYIHTRTRTHTHTHTHTHRHTHTH